MISLVQPIVGKEEKKILNAIIDSRILASGSYVTEFEAVCAKTFQSPYCVAVSNGTTALHAALIAVGVKPGDQVLTTPMSFIATANSILYCQAKPVFADIDPDTFNMSPSAAEAVLKTNKKIKAILLVHLYGTPCDMDAFMRLKKKYNVLLIEDCAQAHGALYKGKNVGTFGEASAFSYYATKNVMCGEGGIVLTKNKKTDTLVRQIINHGRTSHSEHAILGYNYRMTNVAAGLGIVQMRSLEEWSAKRRANATFLTMGLAQLEYVVPPYIPSTVTPVFHQFTVRVKASCREKLMKHLYAHGVGSGVYYPICMHLQPIYQKLGFKRGMYPVAEQAVKEVLSIPVHPALSHSDLKTIVHAFTTFEV